MAALLGRLVRERVETAAPIPRDLELEARVAESGYSDEHITGQVGELTSLSCPECGGPLREKAVGHTARYRCRVGHAYAAGSLLSPENEAIESALWAAVRLFEQRSNILISMAKRDRNAQRPRMVRHHEAVAKEARERADLLRGVLVRQEDTSGIEQP